MSWLLPAGFAALLALPVLVLLRLAGARRRAHTVGALLLWNEAAQGLPAGSGRRLPPWPLLLLELGACAALGLAVAHPAWIGEAPALNVLVVMDRTASMGARGPNGSSAWERGVARLDSALASLPPSTTVHLRAVPPLPGGAVDGPREAVLAVLRASAPDPGGTGEASRAIGGEFHRYLLVTDHMPELAQDDPLEVIAAGEPAENVAITSLRRTDAGWYAVVANFSAGTVEAPLQLMRAGTVAGEQRVTVPPGRRAGALLGDGGAGRAGAVTARIDPALASFHAGDDALTAGATTGAGPLTLAWIGPESPPLRRAIAAASGRRVVITGAGGETPDLTVCHRSVPNPLPSGAVLVVAPASLVPALQWSPAEASAPIEPAGPHAGLWEQLELPGRWPAATSGSSKTPRGGTVHLRAGDRTVAWSGTLNQQPVAVAGLSPDGGWELAPGYPIFWARLLDALLPAGANAASAQRDPSESDLRGAATGRRAGASTAPAPLMGADVASGRPWLILLVIALLAWRLRRRP